MKKRIIAGCLVSVMVFSSLFVGCGTATNNDVDVNTETEQDEIEEVVVEEPSEIVENENTEEEFYTYTELNQTMYAKSSVNVRDLPCAEGEKLGGLSYAEEVTVTGQCNETSWYRIVYEETVAYVSNNYLVEEKPVDTTNTGTSTGDGETTPVAPSSDVGYSYEDSEVYSESENTHKIPVSEEWNLIVVNRWNKLPENYSVTLTELSNGQKVDVRIYSYLQEMFNAASADGIYMVVRDAYRTTEEQQKILDDKVQAYINEGYSQSTAETMAKEWVALPGTSEHQLGSALDINADSSKCSNEDVYTWLANNAYKYGFILRYPQGKQEVTGIRYEPWHYRYVGVEVAQEIYERGICLEEYFK